MSVVFPLSVGPTKTVIPGAAVNETSSRKVSPLCVSEMFLAIKDTTHSLSTELSRT
jgi:hypothetical protein